MIGATPTVFTDGDATSETLLPQQLIWQFARPEQGPARQLARLRLADQAAKKLLDAR